MTRTEANFSVRLYDVEEIVLQEITDMRCKRNTIALTLAFGLRQNDNLDWKKINEAILRRWKPSGREYILKRAWGLAEGKIKL